MLKGEHTMALRYRFKLTPSSIPKLAEEFMSEQSDESRIEEEKLIGHRTAISILSKLRR